MAASGYEADYPAMSEVSPLYPQEQTFLVPKGMVP